MWNRRADVYSLGRWLLRVRFCSPLRSDGGARVPGVAVVSLRRRIMVFLLLLAVVGGAVERSLFLLSIAGDGEAAERILLLRADLGELALLDLLCEFGVGVGVRCLASFLGGVGSPMQRDCCWVCGLTVG